MPTGWFLNTIVYEGPGLPIHLYVNGDSGGSQFTSDVFTTQVPENSGDLVLGRVYLDQNDRYQTAAVDDIKFWNRVLSDAEIQAEYLDNLPRPDLTFDTNTGLTWYSSTTQIDPPATGLIMGKRGKALQTDANQSQWVDLGPMVDQACMVRPATCTNGGAITFWLKGTCPAGASMNGIMSSFGESSDGVIIECTGTILNTWFNIQTGELDIRDVPMPDHWFHFALVYENNALYEYIDGQLVGSDTSVYPTNRATNPGNMVLGRQTTKADQRYLSIAIDELNFQNSPLTQAEVQDIYNGVAPFTTEYSYTTYPDKDCSLNNDLFALPTNGSSVDVCKQQCDDTSNCEGFVYVATGECYFKGTGTCLGTIADNTVAGVGTLYIRTQYDFYAERGCLYNIDITSVTSTDPNHDNCKDDCAKRTGCVGFSLHNNVCWMKGSGCKADLLEDPNVSTWLLQTATPKISEGTTPALSPEQYFPFDNSDGLTWYSHSTVIAPPPLVTGMVNGAIQTNAPEWVDLGDLSSVCMVRPTTCAGGGTIALWIKGACTSTSYGGIVSSYAVKTEGFNIECYQTKMHVYVIRQDKYYAVSPSMPNDWFHFALVYDGVGITSYINGGSPFSSQSAITDSHSANNGHVIVGRVAYNTNDRYLSVAVDDLKFYDKALSATEVSNEYSAVIT